MSISLSQKSATKFSLVRQGSSNGEPIQQIHFDGRSGLKSPSTGAIPLPASDINNFYVIFDESTKGTSLVLNENKDPFLAPARSPADSTTSIEASPATAQRPTLFHSAGMWAKSKKYFSSKVDMRPLYYQHFLNIKKISDYQLDVLTAVLLRAKRNSRVEDSIAISLFLHESSGLRSALDADVDLFRKWHSGAFKGSLRKRYGSEKMLFKGYVDMLNDHWKPLTSEELFELPIIRMLSRTPAEVLATPYNQVKDVNQRTYFNTLVHHVDNKDRGHTLY